MAGATAPGTQLALALIVESVGVAVLTMLAGTSDDIGTIVLIFVIGLWLLFLFNHSEVQTWMTNVLSNTQRTLNG